MSRAPRRRRQRPLSDPGRARYVRAALDRKQRRAERQAALARDDEAQARGLDHIRKCLALVDEDAS